MNRQDQKAIMGTFVVVVVFAALMMVLNKIDPRYATEEARCIAESIDDTTPPERIDPLLDWCRDNWRGWEEKWDEKWNEINNK